MSHYDDQREYVNREEDRIRKQTYIKVLEAIYEVRRNNRIDKDIEIHYNAIINFYKSKLYDLRNINE